jgi:subtilase family serine protease
LNELAPTTNVNLQFVEEEKEARKMTFCFALLALLLASSALASTAPTSHVVKAFQVQDAAHHARHGWTVHSTGVPATHVQPFTVFLAHDAESVASLNQLHASVSDPTHAAYGRHVSKEQLDALMQPQAHDAVVAWLRDAGVEHIESHGDALRCAASPAAIRAAFNGAELSLLQHHQAKQPVARVLGDVAVPAHVADAVSFVAGLTETFGPSFEIQAIEASRQQRKADAKAARDAAGQPAPARKCGQCQPMVPATLRQYYNVSASLAGSGRYGNAQAVSAFSESFSARALAAFGQKIDKSTYPFKVAGVLGATVDPTDDATEGSLDVQYIMAMGRKVPTYFWAVQPSYWILEYVLDVLGQKSPPLVHSLSYGTSIQHQCDIAVAWCGVLGYNSTQYAVRTGLELQKLGARGVTVLVSSGDNGAPGRGTNGHCPLKEYCPLGGCQNTDSACQGVSLRITKSDLSIDCVLPLGIQSYGCSAIAAMLQIAPQNFSQVFDIAMNTLTNDLGISGAMWDSDVEGSPHLYVPQGNPCRSITFSKPIFGGVLSISGFVFNRTGDELGKVFIDEYPGVSSFVTSVGATNFNVSTDAEQADNILNGGIITGGGGFSTAIDQPPYQAQAVAQYLSGASNLPPANTFNGAMRGFPDISLMGERYVVMLVDDMGNLKPEEVSGTSASSPALAGLISLVNEARLAAGLGSLGFLNPLLYRAATVAPQVFNDVTQGDNRCTHQYCCEFGWTAAPGWDPVTGLGSLNFGEFYQFATI